MRWVILTGEYPPQAGGVSDYAAGLAEGLAARGDRVEIWAPPAGPGRSEVDGITVNRLPDHFGWRGRRLLRRAFRTLPADSIVFIQYVPHAYGWKGMNLPFAFGIWRQRRRLRIWTFFHEVAYPLESSQPFRHRVIAIVTRLMARLIAKASARIYVSIPAWENSLRELTSIDAPMVWLPIPSNMPATIDPAAVEKERVKFLGSTGEVIIGHFGTFGPLISRLLEQLLPAVLVACPNTVVLLIGRGSESFAKGVAKNNVSLSARLHAVAELPAPSVANCIGACDLLIQPYPDGVSSRRTTAMTGLALGIPVVTNKGHLTEPLWSESEAISLAERNEVGFFVEKVRALVNDENRRRTLGKRGRALYDSKFDLSLTLEQLRKDALLAGGMTNS
jgi:glycosyltransferase involved in cell wall biosynthesis